MRRYLSRGSILRYIRDRRVEKMIDINSAVHEPWIYNPSGRFRDGSAFDEAKIFLGLCYNYGTHTNSVISPQRKEK